VNSERRTKEIKASNRLTACRELPKRADHPSKALHAAAAAKIEQSSEMAGEGVKQACHGRSRTPLRAAKKHKQATEGMSVKQAYPFSRALLFRTHAKYWNYRLYTRVVRRLTSRTRAVVV